MNGLFFFKQVLEVKKYLTKVNYNYRFNGLKLGVCFF